MLLSCAKLHACTRPAIALTSHDCHTEIVELAAKTSC